MTVRTAQTPVHKTGGNHTEAEMDVKQEYHGSAAFTTPGPRTTTKDQSTIPDINKLKAQTRRLWNEVVVVTTIMSLIAGFHCRSPRSSTRNLHTLISILICALGIPLLLHASHYLFRHTWDLAGPNLQHMLQHAELGARLAEVFKAMVQDIHDVDTVLQQRVLGPPRETVDLLANVLGSRVAANESQHYAMSTALRDQGQAETAILRIALHDVEAEREAFHAFVSRISTLQPHLHSLYHNTTTNSNITKSRPSISCSNVFGTLNNQLRGAV